MSDFAFCKICKRVVLVEHLDNDGTCGCSGVPNTEPNVPHDQAKKPALDGLGRPKNASGKTINP